MELTKTLIDRTFTINNNLKGFHADLQNLCVILRRNLFPEPFPENLTNKYHVLNIFRQLSREGKHNLIQESSPRKHLSFILKSLMLGISQSRHRDHRSIRNQLSSIIMQLCKLVNVNMCKL